MNALKSSTRAATDPLYFTAETEREALDELAATLATAQLTQELQKCRH